MDLFNLTPEMWVAISVGVFTGLAGIIAALIGRRRMIIHRHELASAGSAAETAPGKQRRSASAGCLEKGCGVIVLAGICLWLFWIWSGENKSPTRWEQQLRHFSHAYHQYYKEKQVSPSGICDLVDQHVNFPAVCEKIENDQFVVIWNAALSPDRHENDRYVLAYETEEHIVGYEGNVPKRGRWVIMAGGSLRVMSAEEFRSVLKIAGR